MTAAKTTAAGGPTFRLDSYVVDVLLRDLVGHDHSAAAFLVYLHLWRRTTGDGVPHVTASHREIAEQTGLSKSAVQNALRVLHRRRFVRSVRAHRTATPDHAVLRPWRRDRAESSRRREDGEAPIAGVASKRGRWS